MTLGKLLYRYANKPHEGSSTAQFFLSFFHPVPASAKQHPNVHNEIHMERRTLCERITATKHTNHPFIVQMHAAFDDYEHIYYCMDLHVECGDLWSRLKHETDKKMVGCYRSQAKQWLYQLVDAIEHMHRHGVSDQTNVPLDGYDSPIQK